MDVIDTDLADVKIFCPRRFEDDRGYFMETFAAHKYASAIGDMTFVQDNESFSRAPFTVRGLHYQAPPFAQAKLVRAVKGTIFDVAVDVRSGSPSYGQWTGVELSADNGRQLLVPAGFLHGFMTLEPDCLVAYKVTTRYDAASDGAVHWASPELGIEWPGAADKVVLSEKDAAAPTFSAFASPFDQS